MSEYKLFTPVCAQPQFQPKPRAKLVQLLDQPRILRSKHLHKPCNFCGLGTLISITLACMEATGVSRLQTCVGRWRSAPTRVRWAALDGPFCDGDMPRIPNEPEGCGSHNPKVVAVTVRRLWHHSPKAVEATTRRSWRPQPGGCGSHSPNTVAPQPEGCGSHDPKIVAATTRRLWQDR